MLPEDALSLLKMQMALYRDSEGVVVPRALLETLIPVVEQRLNMIAIGDRVRLKVYDEGDPVEGVVEAYASDGYIVSAGIYDNLYYSNADVEGKIFDV